MIIKNGQVFIDGRFYRYDLEVDDKRIVRIADSIEAEDYYDAAGNYIFPGFIETHIHGGFGHNCGESVEADYDISAQLPQYGVTAWVPTPVEREDINVTKEYIANIRKSKGGPGAEILGIFLYANFRNRSIAYYRKASLPLKEHFEEMLQGDYTDIRMCLLAPELPLGDEFIEYLVQRGIMPVIGYSEGTANDIRKAVSLGARLTDHFPNGMPTIDHHINQAIVGCLLENDLYMQFNGDCIHVDPDYLEMMLRLKGADHLVAVSDNNAMSTYPEGEYHINGRHLIIKDGAIRDPNGKLVTGAHSFDENMRTMYKKGFRLEDLGRMFSENAAKVLGLTDRGKIAIGRKSDLVVMDKDLNVVKTMINGSWFYERP